MKKVETSEMRIDGHRGELLKDRRSGIADL